ncbi:MAG: NTP transferase domain-containing protein [Candidatus Peregrinibacteria bacterium]|nr:NTP transferase domain-containing protein [Candidatus Peregrinibacteria bacterium]
MKFPKVIILAAGQSKRMDPLPDKNFLKFCGKPLLQWQVEQLARAGFRDVAVIGGRHNLDELQKMASELKKPFTILEQKKLEEGMAGAVLSAEKWIGDEAFLVVSSNDIVDDSIFEVLKKAMKGDKKVAGFLVAKKVTEYFPGGYLKVKNGAITGIVEKPGAGKEPSDLVNIVFHLHAQPEKLFAALKKVKTSRDDRYEVAMDSLIQAGEKFVALPYSGFWQPVKYPWHLILVWKKLFEMLIGRTNGKKKDIQKISKKSSIAKSAVIRGDVIIEDGVKVFDHAVIQGPAYIGKNAIVANNVLVRDSHLGEGSVAGYSTEIARSYLSDRVWTHTNYIGDSVIGSGSSFGSGSVTGNLRLDEGPISVVIGEDKVACGSNKLGAIIGENVRIGINVSLMPGVKIGNNCFIGGGISVAKDVPDSKFVYGKWELTMKDNTAKVDPSARELMMRRLKG